MQANLLPFIQASQPSGTDVKAFCGKLNSGDTGFDNILEGILGAATQNNFPTATSSSLNQTTLNQLQNYQTLQTDTQELSMLQNILQKLASALQGQKKPVDFAQLNELLKNNLTDEELSFIQQFLQNTSLSTALQNSGSSELLTSATLSTQSGSAEQQQLMSLLSELIGAVTGIISQQGTETQASSQNMLLQEATAQNLLTQDGTAQDASQNPLQLLMALRDKLQQLYTACMKASTPQSSQVNGTAAGNTGVQVPPEQTGAQLSLQNMTLGSGQTAQTGQQQGDTTGQQVIETAQTGKQILQNLSSLTENDQNQKQQQNFNGFSGRMQAFAGTGSRQNSDLTLAQLFNQNQFGKTLAASSQNLNGQGVDQLLGNAQLWNKLASVPQATVQIEAAAGQTLLNQIDSKATGTEKTTDQSALLKELLATVDTQQTLTRSDQTAAGDKIFAKTPVNSSYIIEQILNKISAAAKQGEQKLSLQLYPPSLGKLHIELAMKDNHLRAVVIAESSQVKQMLDASIDQLRSSLESQNIQVDKLTVMVAGEGTGDFERSASYLRDRAGKGKKHSAFDDALEQAGDMATDLASMLWNRQGIISADAVDVFA